MRIIRRSCRGLVSVNFLRYFYVYLLFYVHFTVIRACRHAYESANNVYLHHGTEINTIAHALTHANTYTRMPTCLQCDTNPSILINTHKYIINVRVLSMVSRTQIPKSTKTIVSVPHVFRNASSWPMPSHIDSFANFSSNCSSYSAGHFWPT